MAFQLESFDKPSAGAASSEDFAPPLMRAGDIHNLANNKASFWDDPLGDIGGIPKFIGLGIASGLNQLYNIAPTIGNWFGGDFEHNKLADTIANYDSDLAQYYEEHQQGIDVLGFALSSIVPGSAGVKALHAAQGIKVSSAGQVALNSAVETGVFGSNISKATGLLAPSVERNVLKATEQFITSGSPFKVQNAQVLRALGAGVGQSALEGAAFEIAVAATMYNSPILENQDLGDMFSNVMWGAGLFGAIGGAFTAAKTIGSIKKGIGAFDVESSPWKHIEQGKAGTSPADNILLYNEQRLSMPSVVPGTAYDSKLIELGKVKQTQLETMIRGEFTKLSPNDPISADIMFKNLLLQDSKTATSKLWELKEAVRLTDKTTGEKLLTSFWRGKKEGASTLDAGIEALEHNTTYVQLRGARAGKISDEAPVVTYLADTVKAGTDIKLSAKGIKIGATTTLFDATKSFDIIKAKHHIVEARQAWAREYFHVKEGTIIEAVDIPLLDSAYKQVLEGAPMPLIKLGDVTFQPANANEFLDNIRTFKQDVAKELIKKRKMPQELAAKVVNVKSDWLSGNTVGSEVDNIFADLADIAAHNERYGTDVKNMLEIPSVLKLGYKKDRMTGEDGNWLHGMESIQRQQRLYQDSADRIAATVLGEDYTKMIPITMEEITKATRMGAGASFISFASGNYGSLGSKFEFLGKATTDIINSKKAAARDVLEPLLYKLQNDQAATIEWSTLMQTVRGSQHRFKVADDGKSLVLADDALAAKLFEAGEKVPSIALKSQVVRDLARAHVEVNGTRVANLNAVRASQGMQSNRKVDTFYAPPPNPKDYPFFAFVVDPAITGTGHSKMLYAATEEELKVQMTQVRAQFPEFKVMEKGAAENYYKSVGQFDYEKTLNENYINTALNRKGTSAPFLVKTDPQQVADELLQWHLGAEAGVVRETVSHVYETQFEALRKLGEQYTLAATSKYGGSSLVKYAESNVQNPYTDYIKTALGINKAHEYPFWIPVQKMFDNKVSQLWQAVRGASVDIKSSSDLQKINGLLQEAGYKGAYYDAALNSAVNSKLPRGLLTSYVQESNAVLSLFALRLDPLNALNNVIGSNVLVNTEIRSLLRNIESKNSDAAGELTKLMKLSLPGTDKQVLNHGRLIANAIKDFHSSDKTLHQFFKDNKFTTDIRTQYMSSLDVMALREGETVAGLETKRKQLVELGKKWAGKGEKISGNTIAEEFNRFVSAHVMKQITDVAVKHGVMDSKTALSYINTFVNRTQGNFMAAQRPMMFQGPVGQAIGLFQTYQFNLLQNLFRHVAEGTAKDTAMLLGLQGSIYGMNGLPAFNAINTHIIGNASGNTDHRDLYSAVYGGAGKDAGDWLMYGLASNMFLHPDLKVNMYTRGDINPRHVTIIPTNPADVPFINAQIKFFGNIFDTVGKMGDGGNAANILLQGIEHNGVSRPLAGLAQTMEAFTNPQLQVVSTNKRGNIVGSNDLMSLMTLGRLLGGKPLDEALTQDSYFRLTAYSADNSAKTAKLGEVVKSTMQAGNAPTQEQMESFLTQYVEAGGKQSGFNKFMMRQLKNATKSQAEQVRDSLTKPYSTTLQQVMGGYDPTPTVITEE